MDREYDGEVDNISLPDVLLLEVQRSVMVESNFVHTLRLEGEYLAGEKLQLDVGLFEEHLGREEDGDVPVIKYSTESTAPALCGQLLLRTPNYYRTLEAKTPGLADPLEGCRGSHQMGSGSELTMTVPALGKTMVFNASGAKTIDSCSKTFMYCTSVHSDSNRLSRKNANAMFGQDYTHGSVFKSSKQLAHHILSSFVATISRAMARDYDPESETSVAQARAWIVHGPVQYSPDSVAEPAIPSIRDYFRKPDSAIYRHQKEYRFWLGFSDTPAQSHTAEILLPIPREMATVVALEG